MKRKIIFSILFILTFYGTNYLCHRLLPKWFDILIGLPLSVYLMYRVAILYDNFKTMKYPKIKATTFVQVSEYDCKQVNVSKGRLYNYWWIQPSNTPIKLKKGEVPNELVGYDLSELGNF